MSTPAPTLTAAELVEATGKRRAASQAAVLARKGVPFQFADLDWPPIIWAQR